MSFRESLLSSTGKCFTIAVMRTNVSILTWLLLCRSSNHGRNWVTRLLSKITMLEVMHVEQLVEIKVLCLQQTTMITHVESAYINPQNYHWSIQVF